MNSNQLISKFCDGFDISITTQEKYPHLTDKLVVDLINGIEVIKDHNKVSESVSSSRVKRFLGGLSGSSRHRQDLINKNVAESLHATSQWLQTHESDFLIVNNSLSVISEKLLQTRQGVMQLDRKLNSHVDDLRQSIAELEQVTTNKSQQLQNHIETIDIRTRAENQLHSEDKKWQAGKLQKLPPELKVYVFLDNLRNGAFSVYYKVASQTEKSRLFLDVKNTLSIRLADDFGVKSQDCKLEEVWVRTSESINPDMLEQDDLHSISYLSSWASKSTPITHAVHQATLEHFDEIPHIFNMKRWVDRSVNEQLVRGV